MILLSHHHQAIGIKIKEVVFRRRTRHGKSKVVFSDVLLNGKSVYCLENSLHSFRFSFINFTV